MVERAQQELFCLLRKVYGESTTDRLQLLKSVDLDCPHTKPRLLEVARICRHISCTNIIARFLSTRLGPLAPRSSRVTTEINIQHDRLVLESSVDIAERPAHRQARQPPALWVRHPLQNVQRNLVRVPRPHPDVVTRPLHGVGAAARRAIGPFIVPAGAAVVGTARIDVAALRPLVVGHVETVEAEGASHVVGAVARRRVVVRVEGLPVELVCIPLLVNVD